MWSAKDKQNKRQRPPTPRWDPSVAVSPTASILHQRRVDPKFGRPPPPQLTKSDNHFQKTPPQSSADMQNFPTSSYQQNHPQDSPSVNSPLPMDSGHFTAVQDPITTLQQLQQLDRTRTTTADPRHVSFLTEPYHASKDDTLLAIHSLPQLSIAQPTPRTRELTPPTSLLSLTFSPPLLPWNSHVVSPFPHRSHSDQSDLLAADSHTADETDLHSDSSCSARINRPKSARGKCPRPDFGGTSLALLKSSRLSIVETAGSSDDQSSSSGQTPASKIPLARGSSSGRKITAYPGSSSSSSITPSAGSSSVTLSPLSDEHRTEMDAQIHRYNLGNEHRVRYIMDERLPTLFKSCDVLVGSILEDPRWATVTSGPVHDLGRLPAREFRKPHVPAGWQPSKIMAEETPRLDNRDGLQQSAVLSSKVDQAVDIDQLKSDAHLEDINEDEEGTPAEEQTTRDDRDMENTAPSTKLSHQEATSSSEYDPYFIKSSGSGPPLLKTHVPHLPPPKTPTEVSPLLKSNDIKSPPLKALYLEHHSVKPSFEASLPFATSPHDSDSKLSPQHSNSSQGISSGESTGSGQKRKRGEGSSSEPSKATRTNDYLQIGGAGIRGECAAPDGRADMEPGPTVTFREHQVTNADPTSGPVMPFVGTSGRQSGEKLDSGGLIYKKQSVPRPLVEKDRPSSKSPHARSVSSQAKALKLDAELNRCMHSFSDCCVQLLIYLQRPVQIASLSERDDIFDYALSKMSTPIHYSGRSGEPEPPTPTFPHAPLSVKTKLKEEVKKLIKGGNDIFIAREKYHTERAELLNKMETCRSTAGYRYARSSGSDGHVFVGEGSGMAIEEMEQVDAEESPLAQLEQCLELMDMRHSSSVRYGALELQSSCAALYQMLRTVFA